MARKRTQKVEARQTAARVAEGIGEALARVVNRLESLDAEREKTYAQLVELQRRVNAQVSQFGRAIGQRVTTATAKSDLGGRLKKRKKPKATRPVGLGERPRNARRPARSSAGFAGRPDTMRADTPNGRHRSAGRRLKETSKWHAVTG